jgi:poly-beta-1,6-N-acetyl-D-glucosamine synthase
VIVVAIVPAYNEAATIAETISALQAQWAPRIDQIIVVPNNCDDDTASVARQEGATVWEYPGRNPHRKAGALNWAIPQVLKYLTDGDYLIVTDADSRLHQDWTGYARWSLRNGCGRHRYRRGAACANFHIQHPRGVLASLQAAEYDRFAQQVAARRRAIVLSGVATMFEVRAVRAVIAARGNKLPGYPGEFYHRDPATEDIELTFAFRRLGYRPAAPSDAVAWTDTMPSWRALRDQRVRWQRGMLDTLRLYGFNRLTWVEWLRQFLIYGGSLVVPAYLAFLGYVAVSTGRVPWSPRWLPLLVLFAVERAFTVRRSRWMAALLVFEWGYEQFRSGVYWLALWRTLRSAAQVWVNEPTTRGVVDVSGDEPAVDGGRSRMVGDRRVDAGVGRCGVAAAGQASQDPALVNA